MTMLIRRTGEVNLSWRTEIDIAGEVAMLHDLYSWGFDCSLESVWTITVLHTLAVAPNLQF